MNSYSFLVIGLILVLIVKYVSISHLLLIQQHFLTQTKPDEFIQIIHYNHSLLSNLTTKTTDHISTLSIFFLYFVIIRCKANPIIYGANYAILKRSSD